MLLEGLFQLVVDLNSFGDATGFARWLRRDRLERVVFHLKIAKDGPPRSGSHPEIRRA